MGGRSHRRADAAPLPARRFWLSAALSLALHGAALLLLVRYPAHGGGGTENRPLAVDAVALAPEPGEEVRPALLTPAPDPQPVAVVPTLAPPPDTPRAVAQSRPAFVPDFMNANGAGGWPSPSPGAMGADGGRVVTAFFQAPAEAYKIVYVLDRSSSMGLNGVLDAVKRELRASLDRLPAEASFQVVFYNRHAEALVSAGQSGLLPASAENKRQAALKLDALSAEGSTRHREALQLALSFEPDVIFFLTDADDLNIDDVRTVTRLNRGRAAIHTFELTTANRGRETMPLQVLAKENRGAYHAVALRP